MNIKESLNQLFAHIYKGNEQAITLSHQLWDVAQTLDDFYDDDPVSKPDVYKFALNTMFNIPNCQLAIAVGLNHHLLGVFLRWVDANTIEQDENRTKEDLIKAYMLRAGIYDIFVIIAYYLHGADWAFEIGPIVRRYYGEIFSEYESEIGYARSSNRDDSTSERRGINLECKQTK